MNELNQRLNDVYNSIDDLLKQRKTAEQRDQKVIDLQLSVLGGLAMEYQKEIKSLKLLNQFMNNRGDD